ncbi:MAG TPA: amidase [Polyangiaceae bacterium]|jgi:amidase|nr:amidase [Polyangiaceae bacterium]
MDGAAPQDLDTTALELAGRLRRRELSSVELTRATFAAIAERDGDLGAFVDLDERRALATAAAADKMLAKGGNLPPFLGVPTAIKDHEHVRYLHTRVGSRALAWVISPFDSKLAQRCREGGFVIVGKTSCSELTILPFVETDIGPPTRNPRARDYYAGGSSGGAAAAVAGGLLSIAPGSDGAGSIRLPASFCGLVGFKPGRGTLFNEHGSVDVADIAVVGPLAKTVRDAAALTDVLDGRVELSAKSSFLSAVERVPSKLRIHVGFESPLATLDPEVRAAVEHAAKCLESLGHAVTPGKALPDIGADEFLPIMARLMANVPLPPMTSRLLQPTTRWMRDLGRHVSDREASDRRKALEKRLDAWFVEGDPDAWLLPTCAVLPPRVGQYRGLGGEQTFRAVIPIGAFTAGFNVSGQPAVSLPAATSKSGLPIGVQLVCRRGDDRRLFGLAASLEPLLRQATA